MVDRMRTTSVLCVAEMCWVMCTIESMATSGLAWTRLKLNGKTKSSLVLGTWLMLVGMVERWLIIRYSHRFIELLPAYLLEDVVAADILDVLINDGPGTLFFGQLPLQPAHYLFIVVPQIGLRNRGKE